MMEVGEWKLEAGGWKLEVGSEMRDAIWDTRCEKQNNDLKNRDTINELV